MTQEEKVPNKITEFGRGNVDNRKIKITIIDGEESADYESTLKEFSDALENTHPNLFLDVVRSLNIRIDDILDMTTTDVFGRAFKAQLDNPQFATDEIAESWGKFDSGREIKVGDQILLAFYTDKDLSNIIESFECKATLFHVEELSDIENKYKTDLRFSRSGGQPMICPKN